MKLVSKNPNIKVVSFKKDEDKLLKHVEGKYFSAYVKELIKKDMAENPEIKQPVINTTTTAKKRITNFSMPES
jgi:quinol monooxygenase YgiN